MLEFRSRLLIPFGVTLGAAAVIVTVIYSLSQVLLALEQEASSTAATGMAVAGASTVVLGAVWVVSRRQVGSRPVTAALIASALVLVAAGSVSSAVLGGDEATGEAAHGGGASAASLEPVTITAFDLGYRETGLAAAAGDVGIRYVNEGELDHTLVFDGAGDGFKLEVSAGRTASGTVGLPPGTYAYYCDLPGHRAAGMEGTLTVADGEGTPAAVDAGSKASTRVVAQDIAFEPTEITVPAGPVEITLTNEGAILHSFVIDGVSGFETLEAAEGGTDTGTLDARPGTYAYYCDKPGHRAAGMEGTLTVS